MLSRELRCMAYKLQAIPVIPDSEFRQRLLASVDEKQFATVAALSHLHSSELSKYLSNGAVTVDALKRIYAFCKDTRRVADTSTDTCLEIVLFLEEWAGSKPELLK